MQKGLKARTEAKRDVPTPFATKVQIILRWLQVFLTPQGGNVIDLRGGKGKAAKQAALDATKHKHISPVGAQRVAPESPLALSAPSPLKKGG